MNDTQRKLEAEKWLRTYARQCRVPYAVAVQDETVTRDAGPVIVEGHRLLRRDAA